MKTAFRQVSLATTAEAEEAAGWVLEKVFEQTPSVFTHPEKSGPILSVYLGEKQRVTEAHRHAVQAGLESVADCGLEVGAGQLRSSGCGGKTGWILGNDILNPSTSKGNCF